MNTQVYIKPSQSGKSCQVYDIITKKPWANERFKNKEEAEQFCKDNKLIINEKH